MMIEISIIFISHFSPSSSVVLLLVMMMTVAMVMM